MKLAAYLGSAEDHQFQVTADTAAEAREAIEAQVPAGHDLVEVLHQSQRTGGVVATARTRPTETRELTAEGRSYEEAKAALSAAVPDGWRILSTRVVEP
ncbi:hypothetical protein [Leifsonia shinshuensis]